MGTRKPDDAASRRTPYGEPGAIRETRVRAALRERRRRRVDEARFQSLVRTLATQMSSGRGR
jgi:hypothetical protein